MHSHLFTTLTLLCLAALSLTSCSLFDRYPSECYGPESQSFKTSAEEISKMSEVIDSSPVTSAIQIFSIEMEKKHKVHLEHAKTFYDDGISKIQLEFSSQNIIDLCEARKLIVDMTETFLAKINRNPLISMDLKNYPFSANSLELYITFESYFGKYIDPNYIHWICMEDNLVDYYLFDLIDPLTNKWKSRHESYPTSREIAVFQQEAEKQYEESNRPKINVFGEQRYYPSK